MREISALDLMFLMNDLKEIINARIDKVFQNKKQIRIELFVPKKGTKELFFEPNKLFITKYKRKAPEKIEMFAQYARKHLKGQKIKNIKQIDFERIIEIETDKNIIIFELFSKGNII
ncbi:MAG: NFACT family protein, partial [Candidatus Aenigmarchaeota archaeon]|nr:NFACT family protein [Candidatus Aenigmarchaeota archaeon]